MKKQLATIFLVLLYLSSFSQTTENKMLIGASINYFHDDIDNNRLLSNILSYNKNYTKHSELLGEINYYVKQNHLIGIELGFNFKDSKKEQPATDSNDESKLNTTIDGILINPKYKFIKSYSDKLLLYTDFKVMLHYYSHKNEVTQIDYSNQINHLNMDGTEFKFGLGINPGLIFKISQNIGIKFDYSLVSISHSTIKKTDDSDIDFDKINAWDYYLNMNLSELNIGIIYTL